MSIHIKNKADLEQRLTDAGNQLVMIDFFATWCGPCDELAPDIEKLALEFPDIIILKVDVDECEEIVEEYGVEYMPYLVFIKNKRIIMDEAPSEYEKLKELIIKHK